MHCSPWQWQLGSDGVPWPGRGGLEQQLRTIFRESQATGKRSCAAPAACWLDKLSDPYPKPQMLLTSRSDVYHNGRRHIKTNRSTRCSQSTQPIPTTSGEDAATNQPRGRPWMYLNQFAPSLCMVPGCSIRVTVLIVGRVDNTLVQATCVCCFIAAWECRFVLNRHSTETNIKQQKPSL